MKKVLITDYVHPDLLIGFQEMGYETVYQKSISLEEVKKEIHEYEGIIINSKVKMTVEMIDRAPMLKFIGRLGSGLEIIDLDYAEKKGVGVFNSPEGNRNAVAEHALGMLLAYANKLVSAHSNVQSKNWEREEHRGFELAGKTIGIIGFGNTGRALAHVLKSLNVSILAYDKYLESGYASDLENVEEVDLLAIQEKANVISFHLPLTNDTKHIVNENFISKCRDEVLLINTSRGKVIDTRALLHALKSKKIRGACLDVFENEKPGTFDETESTMYTELYNHPQVLLSPHVAGWTNESLKKIANTLIYKIKKYVVE